MPTASSRMRTPGRWSSGVPRDLPAPVPYAPLKDRRAEADLPDAEWLKLMRDRYKPSDDMLDPDKLGIRWDFFEALLRLERRG